MASSSSSPFAVFSVAFALTVAMGSCRSSEAPPPSPPVDRNGLGTPLGDVCAALRDAGCPEGAERPRETCFEHLTKMSEIVLIPSECVRRQNTPYGVRGCGSSSELRFRCVP